MTDVLLIESAIDCVLIFDSCWLPSSAINFPFSVPIHFDFGIVSLFISTYLSNFRLTLLKNHQLTNLDCPLASSNHALVKPIVALQIERSHRLCGRWSQLVVFAVLFDPDRLVRRTILFRSSISNRQKHLAISIFEAISKYEIVDQQTTDRFERSHIGTGLVS